HGWAPGAARSAAATACAPARASAACTAGSPPAYPAAAAGPRPPRRAPRPRGAPGAGARRARRRGRGRCGRAGRGAAARAPRAPGGTSGSPAGWRAQPGPVGKAWPISELLIVDADGNPVPPGAHGTIYMKMAGVDFEYKGDKEKTEKSRLKDFFTVGDIGY